MGFWYFFYTAMNLLIPVVMIVAGVLMAKKPPKTINGIYGYRTRRSGKSQEAWDFAQVHCGKLWAKVGIIMTVVTTVISLLFIGKDEDTLGVVCTILVTVQTVVLLVTIYPTELALKKNFDENGKRK